MKITEKNLSTDQVIFFFLLSFFYITISFIVIKSLLGFDKYTELSDNLFILSAVIISEISFLIVILNKKKFIFNKKDLKIYFFLIILLYGYWNLSFVNNYLIFSLTLVLQFILGFILISLNTSHFKINKFFEKENFLILFLSFVFGGIFYILETPSISKIYMILLFSIGLFIINKKITSYKYSKKVDIFFSILIFLILLKVFLLSSEKDSFHYSWYLGPAYSTLADNIMMSEIVSQYGYFSILFIKYFSLFFNFSFDKAFILLIIIFFLCFFFLFVFLMKKKLDYSYFIITTFISVVLFANSGIANISSSIFIPSSSVYRFLPSLLSIFFLSNLLKNKENLFKSSGYLFFISFIISICWSVESAFFSLFSVFSLSSSFILYTLYFYLIEKKKTILKIDRYKKIFTIFSILSFLIIIFFFNNKELLFFYEHLIGLKAFKSLELLPARITVTFVFFIIINYLFLRLSFDKKTKIDFLNNSMWFGLLLSYSTYYIARSHINNFFSILPFIIFITLMIDFNTNIIVKVKNLLIKTIIFFSLIVTFVSFYENASIFKKNLISENFLRLPQYKFNNYKPSSEIQINLDRYNEIPITLITGKYIHNFNNNLKKGGYGMPILPLEQFNRLSEKRKSYLNKIFFEKNNQQLILCLIDCKFYKGNSMNSLEDIFIADESKILNLANLKKNGLIEKLYLISIK